MKDGNGNWNANYAWGVLFTSGGIADRMRAFPDFGTGDGWMTGSDADFSMKFISGTYENGIQRYSYNTSTPAYLLYQPIFASSSLQKFTVPFRGGFDGWDLRVDDPLYITNGAADTNHSVISAKRAIDAVSNPDMLSYNVLALPGIHALKVTDHARNMVNERKDVFYIMDITGSSVREAIDNLKSREIDDNYTACYYPDVKVDDPTSKRIVRLSPSTVLVGALAYSDRTSQVWFAPAGLDRGGLKQFDVVDVVDRLGHDERDDLQLNRINPLATFPEEGIVVFGQKTLQIKSSALDRVNVRRLLIFAKKAVLVAARGLVFEQNDPATWQRFVNKVNPILDRVRRDRGVNRFKVVMDSTTNTNDVVDRNEMYGKIFLEPTKAAEYITIDFIITNAGVQFGS
jgi:phage tail sheath protein FI